MAKKYIYKSERISPKWLDQLNKEGKEGWELVMQATDVDPSNVIRSNGQVQAFLIFVFKKEIIEPDT